MLIKNEYILKKEIGKMPTEELLDIYKSEGSLENDNMKKLYKLSGQICGTYSQEMSIIFAYQELIGRLLIEK